MGIGYQFTDRHSIDYELWYCDGFGAPLRGPQTVFDFQLKHWTFVGAAQTFGRFVEKPFPAIVASWGKMPHVNIGLAGAGPTFFAQSLPLLQKINQSELCFLQVMSGRSVSTRLLRTIGFGGMLEFADGPLKGQRFLAANAYEKLVDSYTEQDVADQLNEARENWKSGYRSLIEAIKVPTICVWVSTQDRRSLPAKSESRAILGDFPHLITPKELAVFDEYGLDVVGECLTQRPEQLLLNFSTRSPVDVFNSKQFAGRPNWARSFNTYYPTPEMHLSVATDICTYLEKNGHRYGRGSRRSRWSAPGVLSGLRIVLRQERARRNMLAIYNLVKGIPFVGTIAKRLRTSIIFDRARGG